MRLVEHWSQARRAPYNVGYARQLSACAALSIYEGELLAPPASPTATLSAAKQLLQLFLAPIASGSIGVNEELIETFPRNRLPILSIHQAKGLEFPMTIVDVGSDFRRKHPANAFKRFPTEGGLPHRLEDLMRRYSPLRPRIDVRAASTLACDRLNSCVQSGCGAPSFQNFLVRDYTMTERAALRRGASNRRKILEAKGVEQGSTALVEKTRFAAFSRFLIPSTSNPDEQSWPLRTKIG